jgi:group I intron endonuclease
MLIYKITNKKNNKVYIGLTTCTLEYRWGRHVTESKNPNNNKHLYKSMRKYGLDEFKIEIIEDGIDDFKELGEKERFYIKQYNSTDPNFGYNLTPGGERNQWDSNPSAKLTFEDVYEIREIYSQKIYSLSEVYKLYSDKISKSGFQKVWEGTTWEGVHSDVYSKENIEYYKDLRKFKKGRKSETAKYTDEEVFEIRKYYVNHTLEETYIKYHKGKGNIASFRSVINKYYKYIPVYKKATKQWVLNGDVLDNILNYNNPVSTISASGE